MGRLCRFPLLIKPVINTIRLILLASLVLPRGIPVFTYESIFPNEPVIVSIRTPFFLTNIYKYYSYFRFYQIQNGKDNPLMKAHKLTAFPEFPVHLPYYLFR